jgi:hypothetical protein
MLLAAEEKRTHSLAIIAESELGKNEKMNKLAIAIEASFAVCKLIVILLYIWKKNKLSKIGLTYSLFFTNCNLHPMTVANLLLIKYVYINIFKYIRSFIL